MLRNDGIGSQDGKDNKRTMGDNENNGQHQWTSREKKNQATMRC